MTCSSRFKFPVRIICTWEHLGVQADKYICIHVEVKLPTFQKVLKNSLFYHSPCISLLVFQIVSTYSSNQKVLSKKSPSLRSSTMDL